MGVREHGSGHGDPRANIQVCVCGRWGERCIKERADQHGVACLQPILFLVWWGEMWCRITWLGSISLFQLHSAPCCSTESPFRYWAPGHHTVKLSFLAFSPWCMSSSRCSHRNVWHQDLALLLIASQRVFSSGLISARLHGLKAHQDLELGCLLSVILKEIARAWGLCDKKNCTSGCRWEPGLKSTFLIKWKH